MVEVWKGGCYLCDLRRVTKAGLRVILATPWYLDQPGPTHDWARYYTVWPLAFKGQNLGALEMLQFEEKKKVCCVFDIHVSAESKGLLKS